MSLKNHSIKLNLKMESILTQTENLAVTINKKMDVVTDQFVPSSNQVPPPKPLSEKMEDHVNTKDEMIVDTKVYEVSEGIYLCDPGTYNNIVHCLVREKKRVVVCLGTAPNVCQFEASYNPKNDNVELSPIDSNGLFFYFDTKGFFYSHATDDSLMAANENTDKYWTDPKAIEYWEQEEKEFKQRFHLN